MKAGQACLRSASLRIRVWQLSARHRLLVAGCRGAKHPGKQRGTTGMGPPGEHADYTKARSAARSEPALSGCGCRSTHMLLQEHSCYHDKPTSHACAACVERL